MAEDGKIIYKVELDDSTIVSDSEKAGEKAGSSFGSKMAKAAKGIGAAAVATTTAVVAVGAAVTKATTDLAEYGDHIDKMSQKLGMSAEAYQEWDAILEHSGANIDSLEPAMKSLFNAAQKGSEAFTALGMSTEEVANMSQEELFSATITALQNMEDETTRTAAANELLGRGAQELGALLNTSAEETEAMRQRVHDLGGVMSDEAVKAAAKYSDTLQDMQTAMDGVKRQLVSEFLPDITTVMEGITEIFSGDSEKGIGLVTLGLNDMLNRMVEMLPTVLETAGRIVFSLAEGIIQNLPAIAETGVSLLVKLLEGIASSLPKTIPVIITVITTIVSQLLKHLPEIISAGIQILVALILGLIEAIPQLIDMLPTIITTIVNVLLQNLPQLIQAGVQILLAIIGGIIKAIPQMLAMIPQVLTALWNAFTSVDWRGIGSNIVNGIWDGIVGLWNDLVAAVSEAMSNLWGSVKSFFGISSPSKKFKWIGEMNMEGMIEGFEEGEDELTQTVHRVYDGMIGAVGDDTGISGRSIENAVSYSITASGKAGDNMIVIPVTLDGREIARATAWMMGEQLAFEEI